jgi:hypothetical protein
VLVRAPLLLRLAKRLPFLALGLPFFLFLPAHLGGGLRIVVDLVVEGAAAGGAQAVALVAKPVPAEAAYLVGMCEYLWQTFSTGAAPSTRYQLCVYVLRETRLTHASCIKRWHTRTISLKYTQEHKHPLRSASRSLWPRTKYPPFSSSVFLKHSRATISNETACVAGTEAQAWPRYSIYQRGERSPGRCRGTGRSWRRRHRTDPYTADTEETRV